VNDGVNEWHPELADGMIAKYDTRSDRNPLAEPFKLRISRVREIAASRPGRSAGHRKGHAMIGLGIFIIIVLLAAILVRLIRILKVLEQIRDRDALVGKPSGGVAPGDRHAHEPAVDAS
jgi:hypothetical protein